jgi:hypothetical protein
MNIGLAKALHTIAPGSRADESVTAAEPGLRQHLSPEGVKLLEHLTPHVDVELLAILRFKRPPQRRGGVIIRRIAPVRA